MTQRFPLLPEVSSSQSSFHDGQSALWMRIATFLSGRAALTRTTYSGILREWCAFLGTVAGSEEAATRFLAATEVHAGAYRVWLERQRGQRSRFSSRESGIPERAITKRNGKAPKLDGSQDTLSNATIAKKLSALRRIYRFVTATGLREGRNPFDVDSVRPPSARSGMKRPTQMIDFSVVREILALPDRSQPKGVRDYALLSILFGGGLRRGEVHKLRIGDVKTSSRGTVYICLRATKARKDVDHAIPQWTAEGVKALIELRRKEGANDGAPLFVGYRGQGGKIASFDAISESGIYRLFKGYCVRAGRASGVSPHSARATAITKLLVDGFSHREVQEFSRHASVQMVETYDKRRLTVEDSPGRKLSFSPEVEKKE